MLRNVINTLLASSAKLQQIPFCDNASKLPRCLVGFSVRHQHTDVDNLEMSSEEVSESFKRSLPMMTSRDLSLLSPYRPGRQVWLESLRDIQNTKLGIVDLHPDIFATHPRLHVLWWNLFWQKRYKHINYDFVKNRAECKGGGRKPWQQKGTGMARHGSIRSPIWKGGGKATGPRGPKSFFFMEPVANRVMGLRVALSVKLAQDNLHVVDSLEIPTNDPEYLVELAESRQWGLSVLLVDDTDIVPENIALAADENKPYNIMPVYGLNCYSMMKHETLVLTLAAVEKIEEKLLYQMKRVEFREPKFERHTALDFSQPHIPS